MVDILAQYDHTKYYYFGGHSEFILSNYWYSFNQGFGGAGIILSYPLAREFANNVMSCLKRYAHLRSADRTTMLCLADLGVNLSPLQRCSSGPLWLHQETKFLQHILEDGLEDRNLFVCKFFCGNKKSGRKKRGSNHENSTLMVTLPPLLQPKRIAQWIKWKQTFIEDDKDDDYWQA
ncbi:hypothetical protein HAX54_008588 [Datura stramonium]|uniref:Uncharacterized protein n=1 Tax=Datura stramonium TaxID=4076 RepID=A0ABS8TDF0_DATST|nr:hypothetical protein [Datura stramonium]